MGFVTGESGAKKCSFENALDLSGFGIYNLGMLASCCSLILAMYIDIFGISVMMPAVACDLSLNTSQQGILTAVPLIGVILSSYAWGLAADTIGRRKTLLIAMPVGFVLSVAASMAPGYAGLTVLKLFSVMFSSAANAAAFVLAAESVPMKNRSHFMFIMTSMTMSIMLIICTLAIPVFKLTFRLDIPSLGMEYRPWRLLLQIITIPCAFGIVLLVFLKESPKYLLSKERNEDALEVIRAIFSSNTGSKKDAYTATHVYLDEPKVIVEKSVLKKIWNQTAPLFKPPLLKNSSILYYLLLCAYMTSTGYTMWVPTLTNTIMTSRNSTGHTFCELASKTALTDKTNPEDCDHVIQPITLYAVMLYSGVATTLIILQTFIVGPLGRKRTTLMIFVLATLCGLSLLFVKIPLLSIALLYMFLYVAQILGNVNSYLVDLNPTHLRGMASCLSVVVSRGFGFFSVQIIGSLLTNHCTATLAGYVILVVSGLIVAMFLPPDSRPEKKEEQNTSNEIVQNNDSA